MHDHAERADRTHGPARGGTLESGKLADFTILEKDPYAVDPDAIMGIKVSETWVGGKKMFG